MIRRLLLIAALLAAGATSGGDYEVLDCSNPDDCTEFVDIEFAIDFTLPDCPDGYGELTVHVPEGRYGDWSTIEIDCGRIVDAGGGGDGD